MDTKMETELFLKASDFLARAGDALIKDEVRYGLIYGIAHRLVDDAHVYGEDDPWFCVIADETGVQAVAMRTPPYNVLLANISGNAKKNARLLADSIFAFSKNIPGVVGDKEIADHFVENWCETQKVSISGKMAQQVYRLLRISNIKIAPGNLRLAAEEDKSLLNRWAHSFHRDVYSSSNLSVPEDDIVPRIDRREVFLWEHDVPVSMAAKSISTINGIRVNFVYTPPELRHRRYATSCVAMLCQEALDSGYKHCLLYADLANPISNSLYKKIGFEEVCDSAEYTFSISSQ